MYCNVFFKKCIFWRSNHFDSWLLISVTAVLYFHDCWWIWLLLYVFFINVFTTSKIFAVWTSINTNQEFQYIGCNQARYVGKGSCLEWLSPLGKFSVSLWSFAVSFLTCSKSLGNSYLRSSHQRSSHPRGSHLHSLKKQPSKKQ